ncbi:outer membrane beta-barrel protein [Belliella kenyensis]|uniref:Outer membrane beta-barrel protein n=1 Tax=Belliella kenyensis TaxID=1472724 RepID=A0ABV8ES13_9BACT|nr:outer membrane beta-barrel protein [Belliella kenyensis]MCH7402812.1 PorT family protein [Belliella kenyensis]MDN3602518.1 outer membrane beta-barrel protein [Belliella kenyensis]
MKEQFDKKLVNKIKDSFEDHHEPFDPQQWEKFSGAYFGETPPSLLKVWLPWASGIAAAIVVALFLYIQLDDQSSPVHSFKAMDEYPISEQSNHHDEYQLPKVEDELALNRSLNPKVDKDEPSMKNTFEKDSEFGEVVKKKSTPVPNLDNTESGIVKIENEDLTPPNVPIRQTTSEEFEKLVTEILPKTEILSEDIKVSSEQPDFLKHSFIAQEEKDAQHSIEAWLKEGLEEKMSKEKVNETASNPMRLGLMLAPQSISNANQSLNLGAGVLSEFSFSKRLKIDVGLAYARQNITPVVNNNVIAASGPIAQQADNSRMLSFSSNFVNASYELSFGQLELPINLKYKVLENNKTGIYLITGVSNMVYLNQRNVGTFTSANFMTAGLMSNSQVSTQTFVETSTPSDNAENSEGNIGQMVNFSLGYEYNLKNGTYLSLEPFYKMSVGGQTFVNQQFAIGGLNLRMNFQFKK